MKTLLRSLIIFCGLLAAAHFLRFGTFWTALAAFMPALGALFPGLVPRLIVGAALGIGLWIWTNLGAELLSLRIQLGWPYLRLASILGAVCLLHAGTLVLLLGSKGQLLFGALRPVHWAQSVAMLLVGSCLTLITTQAPYPVLLGERFWAGSSPFWIGIFCLYAGFITRHMLEGNAPRTRTLIWSLFSAIFFGQLILGLAGATQFLMTGSLHLPIPALILAGPLYRGAGMFMLVLLVVSLLLIGPAWCSYLCYIGAWDDRLSRLGPKRPRPLPAWAPRVRSIILGATILLPIGLRILGTPWPWTLGLAAAFGMAGVGVMLFWSRRSGTMVHCTLWCPMGLLNNLLGRLLPWRVSIAQDCTGCGICATACRYNALTPADLQAKRPGLSCSLCGDCLPRCPHGHLGYAFAGHHRHARIIFATLVVAMHTIFLAVARI